MGRAVRRARAAALTIVATSFAASCASDPATRWSRPSAAELAALAEQEAEGAEAPEDVPTVRIDVGRVVAATSSRTVLRGADVVTVTAEVAGRIERRTPSPGDPIEVGDPIASVGAEPNDADRLRLDILELERQLADLEGRNDDVAAIEEEAADIRRRVGGGGGEIVASTRGTFSHHLVGLFGRVTDGDPIGAIAVGDAAVAVVRAGADADSLDVGDEVTIEPATADLVEPVVGVIASIDVDAATVTIEVPDDAGLAIGDRVEVTLALPTPDVLRVAAEAIRSGVGGDFVVIVDDSGRWVDVDVTIGARGGGVVELIDDSGRLAPGTAVVLP